MVAAVQQESRLHLGPWDLALPTWPLCADCVQLDAVTVHGVAVPKITNHVLVILANIGIPHETKVPLMATLPLLLRALHGLAGQVKVCGAQCGVYPPPSASRQ